MVNPEPATSASATNLNHTSIQPHAQSQRHLYLVLDPSEKPVFDNELDIFALICFCDRNRRAVWFQLDDFDCPEHVVLVSKRVVKHVGDVVLHHPCESIVESRVNLECVWYCVRGRAKEGGGETDRWIQIQRPEENES